MAAATSPSIIGGLADAVFDAQAIFRSVMDATARPGAIVDLGTRVRAPGGLVPATAAYLAALADHDTPVWVEDTTSEAAGWIAFQTGAPVTTERSGAVFAVVDRALPIANWDAFPVGTADYPDRSTTLLLTVDALEGGPSLHLRGPGIEREAAIAPAGLPDGFLQARQANRLLFPRGLDVILVAGTRLLALPRTTHIREG